MTTAVGAGAVTAAVPALADQGVTHVATNTVDPNDSLLRPRQMPVPNQEQDWARVATRHRRASSAQPSSLKALGFEDRGRRDFAIPGGLAPNVVLTFADAADAKAAYREVRSWCSHTGDNVPAGGALLFTDKTRRVEVRAGRGAYCSFVFKSDKNADEGTFEWLGVTPSRYRGVSNRVADQRPGRDLRDRPDHRVGAAANAKLVRLG
ncbi:MAG: hypothetical protein ABI807_05090 [Sporichthyaceae bacterium]